MTENVIVYQRNGQPAVSSRDVAEQFGKEHYHVLRDIENLIGGGEPKIGPSSGKSKTGFSSGALKNEPSSKASDLTAENSAIKSMFWKDEYTTIQNKKMPMYYMNRDGFTLLAMGFTGKEALAWKLKYIQAFNMMEERLKAQEIKAAMPVMDARTMEAQARLNNSRVDAAKLLMKLGDRAAMNYQREEVYAYALHALLGTTPKDIKRIEGTSCFWLKD